MMDFLTTSNISLSLITLISLLVNAVTIFRWISGSRNEKNINEQSFHMVMGLAFANSKKSNMISSRMITLKKDGKENHEVMLILENMYADSISNIESLLATAKALKPLLAKELPYDGQSLLARSLGESKIEQFNQQLAENKLQAITVEKDT